MGLDQYAFVKTNDGDQDEEISYWRKHNRLQGWMKNLWLEKGGEGEFNCVDLELTTEDIDNLEEAIKNKSMPETTGFFFGNDSYEDYEEWYMSTDIEFINKARKVFENGDKLIYTCWW